MLRVRISKISRKVIIGIIPGITAGLVVGIILFLFTRNYLSYMLPLCKNCIHDVRFEGKVLKLIDEHNTVVKQHNVGTRIKDARLASIFGKLKIILITGKRGNEPANLKILSLNFKTDASFDMLDESVLQGFRQSKIDVSSSFSGSFLTIGKIYPNKEKHIIAIAADIFSSINRLIIVEPSIKSKTKKKIQYNIVGSYWHYGTIGQAMIVDIDENDTSEIILTAFNNHLTNLFENVITDYVKTVFSFHPDSLKINSQSFPGGHPNLPIAKPQWTYIIPAGKSSSIPKRVDVELYIQKINGQKSLLIETRNSFIKYHKNTKTYEERYDSQTEFIARRFYYIDKEGLLFKKDAEDYWKAEYRSDTNSITTFHQKIPGLIKLWYDGTWQLTYVDVVESKGYRKEFLNSSDEVVISVDSYLIKKVNPDFNRDSSTITIKKSFRK